MHAVLAVLCLVKAKCATKRHTKRYEHEIETLVINASPLQTHFTRSITPVLSSSGEELDQNQGRHLGKKTLRNVPAYEVLIRPVASSPIIRGLMAHVIKVGAKWLRCIRCLKVGPDSSWPQGKTSTASQIEVLRGPATLDMKRLQ